MKALKIARKPSILDWLFSAGICLLGIFLLSIHHNQSGIKESELVIAEGIPSEVKLVTISTLRRGPMETLYFKIAGHSVQYDGADPHYRSVKSALEGGQPVKVWLCKSSSQLYKLTVGNQEILSYNDTEKENKRLDKTSPILPWAIILLGVLACGINWKQLQNFKSRH